MNLQISQLWWKKLSELGEPTLLIAGGLALFMHFWCHDDCRVAAWDWAKAFGLCILLTVGSKVLGYVVTGQEHTALLRSSSGHVAIATTFYGACAVYLARGHSLLLRFSITLVTVLFVLFLAASRIALKMHSVPEIVVAFFIGLFCLGVFAWKIRRHHLSANRQQLVALLLLLAVARFVRVDGERIISSGTRSITAYSSTLAAP